MSCSSEEHGRARDLAEAIACYGYPHSGAIEETGAEHVADSDPEEWRVGDHHVTFDAEGVRLRCPLTTILGTARVR